MPRWVFESPIDRDRLFRESFRWLDASAAATAPGASPARRSSGTSSPPFPGQVHSTGIYTTDEFVLRCPTPLSPLAPLRGYCAIWRTHGSRYPPRVCVKDVRVDKVVLLPTWSWSDWLLLASAPSTVEGCWSPLRYRLRLVVTDRGNPPGYRSDFGVTGKSAKWSGSSRWSSLAIGEVFLCAGVAGCFLPEETPIR